MSAMCRLVGGDVTRQLQQQLLPPGAGGKKTDPSKAVKLGVLLGSGSFGRCVRVSVPAATP